LDLYLQNLRHLSKNIKELTMMMMMMIMMMMMMMMIMISVKKDKAWSWPIDRTPCSTI
jgi:hypothetical protein